jgi:hypothetical protein
MMTHRENSQDLRQKINLYFDNALPQKDQDELLIRVGTDPDCCQMFNKEKNFRAFIKNNVRRTPASQDIIQSIRDRIRAI